MTITIIETGEKVRGVHEVFELAYQDKHTSKKYHITDKAGIVVKTITSQLSRIVKGRPLLGISIRESSDFTVRDIFKQNEKLCVRTASGEFFLEPA
jgi:hypothetical protein